MPFEDDGEGGWFLPEAMAITRRINYIIYQAKNGLFIDFFHRFSAIF